MKKAVIVMASSAAVLGMLVLADGCALNPFNPRDYDSIPRHESSASSSSTGGMGGNAGMGGSPGIGGAPCMCTDDGNECTDDTSGECPGGDPSTCHSVTFGASCWLGLCNQNGACVDCLACELSECLTRCTGRKCDQDGLTNPQCASKYCQQGTCCTSECNGPCRACDRPGAAGACTRLPLGIQVPGCNGNMICSNDGTCTSQTKAALGALCTFNTDCQSGLCQREYCQSPVNEPCVEDLECETSLCDPVSKTCKSCTGANAGVCPPGSQCMMQNGWCKVPLGQPAQSDVECLAGTVVQGLCSLPVGAACNAHHECLGRNCVGGVCATFCSNAGDCADGGPCSPNGVCGMKAGNYCILNEHCISGNCSGFPRRCQ